MKGIPQAINGDDINTIFMCKKTQRNSVELSEYD